MKKLLALFTVTLLSLLLTGCVSSNPVQEPPVISTVTVPDVINMPGDEAYNILTQLEFTVAFNEDVWMKSNWTVTAQTPLAGENVEKGSSIILTVVKTSSLTDMNSDVPEPVEESSDSSPRYDANGPVTDAITAGSACETYGSSIYRYGFESHYLLGVLAEEPRPDGTFFLKTIATVTNEYGAEMEANMECVVSGTGSSPVVDSFIVY